MPTEITRLSNEQLIERLETWAIFQTKNYTDKRADEINQIKQEILRRMEGNHVTAIITQNISQPPNNRNLLARVRASIGEMTPHAFG